MGKLIEAESRPVYYHDCPALGPHTYTTEAILADPDGEYILARQHKCVFCSYTAGPKIMAKGVTQNPDGTYSVQTSIAERMVPGTGKEQ